MRGGDRPAEDTLAARRPPGALPLLALGIAALLIAGAGAVGALAAAPGGTGHVTWGGSRALGGPTGLPTSAPGEPAGGGFSLEGLPPEVAAQYAFARRHADVYARIPCFCGCAQMLGHRNLADCFVTPAGTWESHAAGCAVCLGESEIVMRMMGRGMGPPMMRDRIVARFGGPSEVAMEVG
ncbi:MAG: hypothetical protein KatS3mg014_1042 [Actinomycetota bacterium]|nr:MAG: hypothetical protein KatS3mg014_1042 [Actinomycetota bacterium]